MCVSRAFPFLLAGIAFSAIHVTIVYCSVSLDVYKHLNVVISICVSLSLSVCVYRLSVFSGREVPASVWCCVYIC